MASKLIKERLIECRKEMNITKQEAAKRTHMSQPAYLQYESGDRMPSVHIIRTMADELNTSVEYLIGETDDPAPTSYVIKSSKEPELFRLIVEYISSSEDDKKRLLAYLKKFPRSE